MALAGTGGYRRKRAARVTMASATTVIPPASDRVTWPERVGPVHLQTPACNICLQNGGLMTVPRYECLAV